MRPAEDRLARLLERHPELCAVRSEDPSGAIIRRGELLVPARHAAEVEQAARRWTDRRTDLEALGAARFSLRHDTDVLDLIDSRLSPAGGEASAAPVHMFRGEPSYQGGPGGVPSPLAAADAAPSLPPAPPSAHAVTVAVLDTGLAAAHPWFPADRWEAVGDDVEDRLDTDNDYELDAQAGHGTFIAGIVRQHAPGARLMVGRVLGSDGVCDEVDLLLALNALRASATGRNRRIGVLNLSLGAYTWNDQPPALLSLAIEAIAAETVVVAAAGNNSSDRVFWPAAFAPVVAVGALTADGSGPAPFTNHGPWVDSWAPGEGVTSSFVTFDGPGGPDGPDGPDSDRFTGFATWSGTSFAAPRVAADVAHRAQVDRKSPKAVLPSVLTGYTGAAAGAAPTADGHR